MESGLTKVGERTTLTKSSDAETVLPRVSNVRKNRFTFWLLIFAISILYVLGAVVAEIARQRGYIGPGSALDRAKRVVYWPIDTIITQSPGSEWKVKNLASTVSSNMGLKTHPIISVSATGWTLKCGPKTNGSPSTIVINPRGEEFSIGSTAYPDTIFPVTLWIVAVRELHARFLIIRLPPAASGAMGMPILYIDEQDKPTLAGSVQFVKDLNLAQIQTTYLIGTQLSVGMACIACGTSCLEIRTTTVFRSWKKVTSGKRAAQLLILDSLIRKRLYPFGRRCGA